MKNGKDLSHVDETGRARMVNISEKPRTKRTARAGGKIYMDPGTIRKIRENLIKKGDVLTVANIAGIMGAKRTSDLIPLCHPIAVDSVEISFDLGDDYVGILSRAVCTDKTGIEMEALTAVSIAALAVYDMCKAVDKTMRITEVRLLEKTKEVIDAPDV
jgi:cyclic pyranopterin phosphate synthase